MERRGKRQAASIFGGMGFYIALLVCVLAAGVVGYQALLSDGTDPDVVINDPVTAAVDQVEPGEEVPVSVPEKEPVRPVISQEPVVVVRPPVVTEDEETPVSAPAEVEIPEIPAAAEQPAPAPVPVSEPAKIVSPVLGETVAVFSVEQLIYDATLGDWRTHDGVDIEAAAGTSVVAAAAGTVISVTEDGLLGVTVVVDHHNGYISTYASLQPEPMVAAGDSVAAGEVIGIVGSSALSEAGLGAHLHFSVTKDGKTVDPLAFLEQ